MGCIVQVVNLSGTCLCVSGVVSSFPAAIERATITSTVINDSGTNIFISDIVPINPPCFEIIEASYDALSGGSANLKVVMTNGPSFVMKLAHGDLLGGGGIFVTGVIQHAPLLLHSGDAMNIQFDNNSILIHDLRITETDVVVGR